MNSRRAGLKSQEGFLAQREATLENKKRAGDDGYSFKGTRMRMINNTGICAVVGPLSLRDFEKKPGGQGWQEPLHTRQLQSQWHKFFKLPNQQTKHPHKRRPVLKARVCMMAQRVHRRRPCKTGNKKAKSFAGRNLGGRKFGPFYQKYPTKSPCFYSSFPLRQMPNFGIDRCQKPASKN